MVSHSQFYSRTQHLLLSSWGSRWKDVSLAMFTAFVDDSGTSPDQNVAIASALIIPSRRIVALDRAWGKLKERGDFDEFHTSKCVADWDEEKLRKVTSRIRRIIKTYGVKGIAIAIKKADYDEVVPESLRAVAGKCHYTWAIRHVLNLLDRWCQVENVRTPFEYVFDWMDPKSQRGPRAEIVEVMDSTESLSGETGRYTNYGFRKRAEFPALQCADFLAWACYGFARNQMCGEPVHPLAERAFSDFENFKKGWLSAVREKREHLELSIRFAINESKMEETLREWREEKAKKSEQIRSRKPNKASRKSAKLEKK